jgi:phospholipase A1
MSRATGSTRLRLPGWLAVLAGAVPLPSLAQPAVAGGDCLEIEDGQERLACFDRAVGEAVRASTADGAAVSAGASGTAAAGTTPSLATAVPAEAPPAPTRPTATSSRPARSLIDTAWGLLPDSKPAYVRLHRPNYILAARYSTDVNRAPYESLFEAFDEEGDFGNVEAKFQLSVKGRLAVTGDRRWGLWFAYTQQSQWQVYESDISRPFRETNYEPELFGTFHPDMDLGGWRLNLVSFGYNHQSNGRADPISRSWDRLFVEAGVERGNLVVLARAWARIRIGEEEDDNPGITDYYGNAEINALYKWRGNTFTLMGRGNPSSGKGAAQFTWSTRPLLGPLRGYVQLFTGYGESLIDYDWRQSTIGVGITVNERF